MQRKTIHSFINAEKADYVSGRATWTRVIQHPDPQSLFTTDIWGRVQILY